MTREEKIEFEVLILMLVEKFSSKDDNSVPTRKVLIEKLNKIKSDKSLNELFDEYYNKIEKMTINGILNQLIGLI